MAREIVVDPITRWRPRQGEHLPRRPGQRGARLLQIPSPARFEKFAKAGRVETCPDHVENLRGLPHGASHGGAKASTPSTGSSPPSRRRRSASWFYSTFSSRTRAALLLPRRSGLRGGPPAPRRRAEHPGRAGQGGLEVARRSSLRRRARDLITLAAARGSTPCSGCQAACRGAHEGGPQKFQAGAEHAVKFASSASSSSRDSY